MSDKSPESGSGEPVHLVRCPTCGKTVPWLPSSRWRPFCSDRCRLIDLGAWAGGGYAIPGEDADVPDSDQDDEGY